MTNQTAPRVPTEAEMRDAAVRLGLLNEGDAIPPRMRGKLARVVQLAATEDAETRSSADLAEHIDRFVTAATALGAKLSGSWHQEALADIVTTLAPQLWRATEGATK